MVRERFRDARDTAADYAHRAGEQASDYMHRAGDGASAAYHRMEESPIAHSTGSIPTDAFLIGAAGSIVGSLVLKFMGRDRDAQFVGHWAPTFLALGILSKLIEHDEHS